MAQFKLKALFFAILFWMLLLSSPLGELGLNTGFLDELIVLAMLPLVLAYRTIDRRLLVIWCLLMVFCVFSVASTYASPYFRGSMLTVLDLFLFCKPVVLLLLFLSLSDRVRITFLKYVSESAFVFVMLAFFFYLLNLSFPVFEAFEVRLGLEAYSFILSNPGEFLNMLVILGGAMFSASSSKRMMLGTVLTIFLALTTLRFKAFVVVVFGLMVAWFFSEAVRNRFEKKGIELSFKKLFPVSRILFVLAISALPGWVQFEKYFLGDVMTPRLFLVINGVAVAGEYFPFGAGPGTYGSAVSKMYYSPLYVSLGFDQKYGLSSDETNFLSDNFWPMVFAQYGVSGALLVFGIYALLVKYLLERIGVKGRQITVFVVFLFSLVMSTLGAAILIGPIGCLYMMMIASLPKRKGGV